MITAETVNGIVRFQANGLPVVSLYCRVDPGASQREVRARVYSLLDQIRPLAKDRDLDHRYRLSVRADIERIKDALGSARWPPRAIAIFSCSGRDLYEEIPLPRRVREQVMVDATPLARPGTFRADPGATPVAEIRSSAEGIMRRYRLEQDQRLVAHVLELAAAGGLAALGTEDCLWAGSMSAIDTLLLRDGTTLLGVLCDESRWLAASGDVCPVCGKPTRYTPDVLDELAAAVIETGGSARQIAADLMPEEYPTAAQLRFPPPPRE